MAATLTLTLVRASNALDNNLCALFRHTQHRTVTALQRYNVHSIAAALATLAGLANLDGLVLGCNAQSSIVFAHDVSDRELSASIVLCGSCESLECMW